MYTMILTRTATKLAVGSINGPHFLVNTYEIDPTKPKIQIIGNEYVFNKTLVSQDYYSKADINDMIRHRQGTL